MQKCGSIEKFDMLFHKSGPQIGQPRGYAFVTYENVSIVRTVRSESGETVNWIIALFLGKIG